MCDASYRHRMSRYLQNTLVAAYKNKPHMRTDLSGAESKCTSRGEFHREEEHLKSLTRMILIKKLHEKRKKLM